jgi:hypothetical protein
MTANDGVGRGQAGRWVCPFAMVPDASFGDFMAFASFIESKEAADGENRGVLSMLDYLRIAQAMEEGLPVSEALGWMGDAEVHGASPMLLGDLATPLARRGLNFSLAPDPDHCLYVSARVSTGLPGRPTCH